jgi:hypothetical protein
LWPLNPPAGKLVYGRTQGSNRKVRSVASLKHPVPVDSWSLARTSESSKLWWKCLEARAFAMRSELWSSARAPRRCTACGTAARPACKKVPLECWKTHRGRFAIGINWDQLGWLGVDFAEVSIKFLLHTSMRRVASYTYSESFLHVTEWCPSSRALRRACSVIFP